MAKKKKKPAKKKPARRPRKSARRPRKSARRPKKSARRPRIRALPKPPAAYDPKLVARALMPEIVEALIDEVRTGKGIARLRASEQLAKLADYRETVGAGNIIEIQWVPIESRDGKIVRMPGA